MIYLENLEKSSVESNVLKGVSATSKAVGKFIGSIPKIKDGQIDERLQETSERVRDKAKAIESDSIIAFADILRFRGKLSIFLRLNELSTELVFCNGK